VTPQQTKKWFADNAIRYVLAQFVDIHGAAKAKAVPVEHYDMVLGDGAGFAVGVPGQPLVATGPPEVPDVRRHRPDHGV